MCSERVSPRSPGQTSQHLWLEGLWPHYSCSRTPTPRANASWEQSANRADTSHEATSSAFAVPSKSPGNPRSFRFRSLAARNEFTEQEEAQPLPLHPLRLPGHLPQQGQLPLPNLRRHTDSKDKRVKQGKGHTDVVMVFECKPLALGSHEFGQFVHHGLKHCGKCFGEDEGYHDSPPFPICFSSDCRTKPIT
jgi:hypothetical protein